VVRPELPGGAAPTALGAVRDVLAAATRPARAAPGARAERRPAGPAPRRLQVRHAATGARFAGPYHDGRRPDPAAMAELSAVLADARTGAARQFDPRARSTSPGRRRAGRGWRASSSCCPATAGPGPTRPRTAPGTAITCGRPRWTCTSRRGGSRRRRRARRGRRLRPARLRPPRQRSAAALGEASSGRRTGWRCARGAAPGGGRRRARGDRPDTNRATRADAVR
jgi:hypothetical protein